MACHPSFHSPIILDTLFSSEKPSPSLSNSYFCSFPLESLFTSNSIHLPSQKMKPKAIYSGVSSAGCHQYRRGRDGVVIGNRGLKMSGTQHCVRGCLCLIQQCFPNPYVAASEERTLKICTERFIAALFVTTQTWKQPRCPW